jgi:eukaryotic-like serine/threonine-protein kinase
MGARPFPVIGKKIAGRYQIVRSLGRGGMGAVFEALDEEIGRRVAIKIIANADDENDGDGDPSRAESAERAERAERSESLAARMLREAKIVGQIDHPNVVRLFDASRDDDDGHPMLVMELLSGRDLATVIKEEGAQSVERSVRWVLDAAAGIAAAHARGVVHRDIKPSNLFLTTTNNDDDDGHHRVVVLDFGASRAPPDLDAEALTRTAGYIGTPLYASPEQLADARTADARSDVWGLGLVLYELLTGLRPFERGTLAAVGAAIVRDEPEPIANVPAALDALVRKRCLAKEAARRFASMDALARALRPFAVGDNEVDDDDVVAREREETTTRTSEGAIAVVALGAKSALAAEEKHKKTRFVIAVSALAAALLIGGWFVRSAMMMMMMDGDNHAVNGAGVVVPVASPPPSPPPAPSDEAMVVSLVVPPPVESAAPTSPSPSSSSMIMKTAKPAAPTAMSPPPSTASSSPEVATAAASDLDAGTNKSRTTAFERRK